LFFLILGGGGGGGILLLALMGLVVALACLRIGGCGLAVRPLANPHGDTSGFEDLLARTRPSAPFCAKAISLFASSSANIGAIGASRVGFLGDSGVLSMLLDAAVLLLLPLPSPE
jgi:hypothetical protein